MPRRSLLLPPVLAVEEGAHPPGAYEGAPPRGIAAAAYATNMPPACLLNAAVSLNKSRQKSA